MPPETEDAGLCPDLEPTIGFICPLYLELAAVLAIFDECFTSRKVRTDGDLESVYYYERIGARNTVAVSFADKKFGPSWAATHATNLFNRHKSLGLDDSACFLVGIAAGINGTNDVRLGDVVIAREVVDWTSGKINSGQSFESTGYAESVSNAVRLNSPKFCNNVIRLGERIRDQAQKMQPEYEADQALWECPGPGQDILFQPDVKHVEASKDCQECERRFQKRDPRYPYLPMVHCGLIAAGNVVLKDAETREKIREDFKDRVLAVEMEAHGAMTASKRLVTIRGICDYGDSHKNKRWQHYAAVVAAACARLWIEDIVLEDDAVQEEKPKAEAWDHAEQVPKTSEHWTTQLDLEVFEAELHIRDGPVGKQSVSTRLEDFHLALEVQDNQDTSNVNRRLRLSNTDHRTGKDRFLWIPNSQVQVSRDGQNITIDFSNCNQCERCKYGRFSTKNGIALYRTTYDAAHPNVGLDVKVVDDTKAMELCELLMFRDQRLLASGRDLPQDFAQCRIFCRSSTGDHQRIDTIFVWARQDQHEISDLGSFSRKLDFDICPSDQFTDVYLGYMQKFIYQPVDTNPYPASSTPPTKVKENYDGRPGSVSYGGGSSLSSHLYMKVNRDEVCRLLSHTIGNFVAWRMRAFAENVDITLVTSSKTKRNKEFGTVQLSAWENGQVLRVFARAPKDKMHNKKCRWIACTVERSSVLNVKGDCDATLDQDTFHQGDFISSTTFLPASDELDSSSDGNGSSNAWSTMRMKFQNNSDRILFENLF